ncbi:MAG: hypothetical protein JO069_04585 [Verrucomicrobia bacterium]|nr:hypothetical protein [Verrucomicrobiota bacterium]
MVIFFAIPLLTLLMAGVLRPGRSGALKLVACLVSALLLNGCLSISTTKTERPRETQVTRTETVYTTENGTRVQHVVTVDPNGRRYYVEKGRTIYVDRYEY